MISKLLEGVDKNLVAKLVLFHTLVIAVSNYLVTFTFDLAGHPLTYAAFTFPLVIVATDLTVRLLGKEVGRAVVAFSYIPAVVVSILVILAEGAPSSVAFRIGFASGTAYLIGTLLDVYVFQYVRERLEGWYWAPALSTVVANFIDTFTFFYVGFANGADPFMAENWHVVAWNQTLTKLVIGLAVFLPAYGVLLAYLKKKVAKA
jgi:queuosine precursor transporter